MPVRIVIHLDPANPCAVPPAHTGPAVYAAFLDAVRHVDFSLSAALHDAPRYKPFTLSPLLGEGDTAPIEPGGPVRFEVALLADELTGPVLSALTQRGRYRFGTTRYRTVSVAIKTATPYQALAEHVRHRTRWDFRLVTPVSFATARGDGVRRQRPWPDAVRVFTNLARRWEVFAGEMVPEVGAAITEHLETIGGEVRIVDHLVKVGMYRRGVVGAVQFGLAEPGSIPQPALLAVNALASFAEFAGFGDRTAVGMGYVYLRQ